MDGSNQSASVLGTDVKLEGILSFTDTFRLNGDFTGNIFAGGSLIVGEKGRVRADINVSSLVSSGEIIGNIVADHRVEIRSAGKVLGDIVAPVVIIEPGAQFEGQCRHPRNETRLPQSDRGMPPNMARIKKIA